MRVVFVTHQYPPHYNTGTELYAKRLALKMRGHLGIDVRIFTFEPSFGCSEPIFRREETSDDGVAVTRVWMWPGFFPNRPLGEEYNVFLAKEFRRYLNDVKPDVVHFFHAGFHGAALLEETYLADIPSVMNLMDFWFVCPTAQLLKKPSQETCDGPEPMECLRCLAHGNADYQRLLDFTEHDGFELVPDLVPASAEGRTINNTSTEAQFAALRGRPAFLRGILNRVDRVVAPSKALRDIFCRLGYDESRFDLVRYGVDPMPFYTFQRTVTSALRIGFIGSINRPKGLHLLVEALHGIDGDFTLDIFGNPAHFPDYAEDCFRAAKGDDRLRVRGAMRPEHVATSLRDLDVLVVPSIWHENTPFVVLEGRAAGVPIVGSDVAGIAELIDDGKTGRLFKAGSVESLREVLVELIGDREQVAQMTGHFVGAKTLLANAREFGRMYRSLRGDPQPIESVAEENRSRDDG